MEHTEEESDRAVSVVCTVLYSLIRTEVGQTGEEEIGI